MGVFALIIFWAVLGCIIMMWLDGIEGYTMTRDLRRKWPQWFPRALPNWVLLMFWPLGVLWFIYRRVK